MVPGVAASLPHMCPYQTDVQLNTDPVINNLIDGTDQIQINNKGDKFEIK